MPGDMHAPRLMLVTDRTRYPTILLPVLVSDVVAAGVDAVQLREKDLPAAELLELAHRLREVTTGRALLFVNSAVDVALAAGADAVQLGEDAESVSAVRARTGDRLLIGRSVHSVGGAMAAERAGADLLVLGTIYPSRSHPGGAASGPALVEAVTGSALGGRLPVIGIGGIDEANAADVVRAGASGVAVISAILAAPNPVQAARRLREAVDAALLERPRIGRT